jgi:tetratricopeptide (TPR) repeat protein
MMCHVAPLRRSAGYLVFAVMVTAQPALAQVRSYHGDNQSVFERYLAEARAYDRSPNRNRDRAVEMYRAALRQRPVHDENLDIELRIAELLYYQMRRNEEPRHAEARDLYRSIVDRYRSHPKDIRILQARIHLWDLNRLTGERESLTPARETYKEILDLDESEIEVPQPPASRGNPQVARTRRAREAAIRHLKEGAAATYVSSYILGIPDPLDQIRALKQIKPMRPEDPYFQRQVDHLIRHFDRSRKQEASGIADAVIGRSLSESPHFNPMDGNALTAEELERTVVPSTIQLDNDRNGQRSERVHDRAASTAGPGGAIDAVIAPIHWLVPALALVLGATAVALAWLRWARR